MKRPNEPLAHRNLEAGSQRSKPLAHQHAHEIEPYRKIAKLPIALDELGCGKNVK
jgi:hypothetical protein